MRLSSHIVLATLLLSTAPAWAGPISVTNTSDAAIGSLRDAINNANAAPDFNDINFAIPGPGPWVIHLLSPLPAITSSLAIHGSTAAGYVPNTAAPGLPMNGTMRIEIDGASAGLGATGIFFAHDATIDGLVINNFGTSAAVGGNGAGIGISRCYLGTDLTGLVARPNRDGILLSGASGASISGCLIAGNSRRGIELNGCGTSTVGANYIGTDKTGVSALPNGSHGVWMNESSIGNTIGQQPAAACTLPTFGINIIAFNGGNGIRIGGGGISEQNRILSNIIYANEGLGIDLDSDGVTANDALDPDAGNNQDQNYPVLVSRSGNTVYGYLKSSASQTYTVQLYWTFACDATAYGQGQQYLGFKTVTTDGTGLVVFNFACGTIPAGGFITALATDANGNTSEFSKCLSSPPTAAGALPRAFVLRDNVPNPFNPATTISYQLATAGHVRIDVYDAAGAFVRTLVDESRAAGEGSVTWNGEDASGQRVASGMYFYRMRAGAFDETRKMVLLK